MDTFIIDVRLHVPAAYRAAAEEFVESCLSHETSVNPALEVVSIQTAGVVEPHPEHTECWDGCGLDVTHDGPCRDKPGGRIVCEHSDLVCEHCGQELTREPDGARLLVDVRTGDWWCRANPSNGGDAAPHEAREN